MQPPDPAEVRSQLERVLSAGPLANAGRLSRFLRYIVERTLAGEGEQLKEYVLGTEAAAQYTGEMRPVREIGKALGADLVMEGSLVVEQGRLKVTARLGTAALNFTRW